jgi:hypothetical protein
VSEQRLTKRQAAIIGAYTGFTAGPFGDVHEYVDSLPGFEGITTMGFASQEIADKIREAAKADFLGICYESDRGEKP